MKTRHLAKRSLAEWAGFIFIGSFILVGCGAEPSFKEVEGDEIVRKNHDEAFAQEAPEGAGGGNVDASTEVSVECLAAGELCVDGVVIGDGAGDFGLASSEDVFYQNQASDKKLDLLLVVDNSGSMADEQDKLTNLDPLLDFVKDADWNVAITTTDASESNLRLLLEKDDSSQSFDTKKNLFANAIDGLGTNGSGHEQGIPMAIKGLEMNKPSTSSSWVRPDSMVAVLVVSDEDNCSTGGSCAKQPQDLVDFFGNDLGRNVGDTAKMYAIVQRNASECNTAYNVGNKYVEAVNMTGGIAQPICASSYEYVLSAISADIGTTLEINFSLSHTPIQDSIEIKVDGAAYNGGYSLSGKTVVLSVAPAAGAKVEISYDYELES